MFAHLYNAPKRTGFKFMLIICASQDISDAGKGPDDDEIGCDSKKEARQIAKERNAEPHNF